MIKNFSVKYIDSTLKGIEYKNAVASLSHRSTNSPYGGQADGVAKVDSITPLPYIKGLDAVSINHGYAKDKNGNYYVQKGMAIGVGGLPYAYTESYSNVRNNTSGDDINLSGLSIGASIGVLGNVSGDVGLDGTITTSTGTSTSGGADIHITSVERLYPISVVDYNDAESWFS